MNKKVYQTPRMHVEALELQTTMLTASNQFTQGQYTNQSMDDDTEHPSYVNQGDYSMFGD